MAGTSQRSSEELEPDLSVQPAPKRSKWSETSDEPSVKGRSTESTETPSTSKISLETDVTSEQEKDKQSSDVAESAGTSEQSALIGETSTESSEELVQTAESSEELVQTAESTEELIQKHSEACERERDTAAEAIPGTSQGTELGTLKYIVMKCSNPVNRRTSLAVDDESMSNFPLRSNSAYETLSSIGGGAYGTVFKAKDKSSGQVVALKKIRVPLSEDGLPVSTVREIAALKSLEPYEHPHIVRLLDVCQGEEQSEGSLSDDEQQSERSSRGLSLWLVFEHVERDLDSFIKSHRVQNPRSFIPSSQVRQMMKELLTGVDFLHSHRILHRDLKPQNILVTRDGRIKIADFGLAKTYDFEMRLTSLVATLWYRAPEVLLGCSYASSVDIWSVGCIFAELCRLEPLFPGGSEGDQLDRIFQVLGTPTQNAWPENVSLSWNAFPYRQPKHFGAIIPDLNEHGLDLIQSMLVFNPESRITAAQALTHRYFN
ncbi:cyclin-dependent kinase 4 [Ooceraea biroi]|nr:cyclin-dependent kinase 4 [Ooceraea biroi]XP_011339155.1 cyclin-dependent kinase 4 [Ooceraea biroi]XP_011339156.1 cyclin-dependent kinase 4 [Ooceraea biroi]EZA54138.1 Cyclin-dependent kinase [Ooceraea biroi]